MAEELIVGWHRDEAPMRSIYRGILRSGDMPNDVLARAEIGNAWIKNNSVKKFLSFRYSLVGDALWDGCPDSHAVELLLSLNPDKIAKPVFDGSSTYKRKKLAKRTTTVWVRTLDKRHDWGTVK